MSTLVTLLEKYTDGPRLLREAVKGMSKDQLLARPVPGKWSTMEVVCHLSDFDPILADRMKRMIALERPSLLGADENRFVATLAYHERDLEEELQVVEVTRLQMARILRSVGDGVLSRIGVHNERGEMTLERMLTAAGNHIPHHLAFISEKKKALGLLG